MTIPTILLTDRLLLRKPRMEDGSALFQSCLSDPEVTRFLTWQVHRSVGETEKLVRESVARWDDTTQAHWVVTLLDARGAEGMLSLRLETSANLSYFLSRRLWGKGLMAEAIVAAVGWAMEQPEIGRVWAFCECGNIRSIRVLERSGFVCEGKRERYAVFPNIAPEALDCLVYGRGTS